MVKDFMPDCPFWGGWKYFSVGINPILLVLTKVGPLASKLLVWPDEGWLQSFSGLTLGTQLPLFPSAPSSEVAPCKPPVPITTRQEPFLPLLVQGGKHSLHLVIFYYVPKGLLFLILWEWRPCESTNCNMLVVNLLEILFCWYCSVRIWNNLRIQMK